MHRSEYQEEISSWSEEACGVWDSTKDVECNDEGATSWISAGGLGNVEFESAPADLGNVGEEARTRLGFEWDIRESERERVEKVRNFLKLNRANRPITVFFPFKNLGPGGLIYTG